MEENQEILKRNDKKYKIKRRKNGTFRKGRWIKTRNIKKKEAENNEK